MSGHMVTARHGRQSGHTAFMYTLGTLTGSAGTRNDHAGSSSS
jgi:hypothetical protein